MARVAITGGPRTGKTTAAGPDALHTDDLVGLPWEQQSVSVAQLFTVRPDADLTVEGTLVARGLRKWLQQNPEGRPVDVVRVMTKAHVIRSPGQVALDKGVNTVLQEIEPELRRRGVSIERI